jgi:Amt family ammonium transporter
VLAVVAWSLIATAIIYFVTNRIVRFRVKAEQEIEGLDTTSHGERAYHMG